MAEEPDAAASLEGRRAIVTGGGSGIGAALVAQLGARGAAVVAVDLDERGLEALARATGTPTLVADVADRSANTTMVARAVEMLGGLDLVFLNAGILGRPIGDQSSPYRIDDLDPARYRAVAAVNIDGVVFGTIAAAQAMRDGGAIVATASAAGLVPWPPDPFYTATKHAVVGWVRAIAPALEADGITIDAICPGGVATPLVGARPDEAAERPNLLDPAAVADAMIVTAIESGTGRALSVVAGREHLRQEHRFADIPGFG